MFGRGRTDVGGPPNLFLHGAPIIWFTSASNLWLGCSDSLTAGRIGSGEIACDRYAELLDMPSELKTVYYLPLGEQM